MGHIGGPDQGVRRARGRGSGIGTRPLSVAAKELKSFLTDPQTLFFSLALPLFLVALMVASFGGQEQFRTTAYVVNLNGGPVAAEFIARLEDVPGITVNLLEEAAARKRLEHSGILCALVIPAGFSEGLSAGRTPDLIVLRRGTGGQAGQIVTSYALAVAQEVVSEHQVAGEVASSLTAMGCPVPRDTVDARVAALFREFRAKPPVKVTEEAVGARADPVVVYLPGLVTMFTLFSLTLTAVGIVEERKKGTLERLMTTRLTRVELLMGKWLGSLGQGLVLIVFLFSVAWVLFHIFTTASFLQVLAFGAVSVVSVAGMGLVIASLARTADQANWIAVFFTMVMTILGGSFFDLSGARGVLATLTRLTYNFWANDGFRRLIAKGETLGSPALVRDMVVLIGIAVMSWGIALAFFRIRGDER